MLTPRLTLEVDVTDENRSSVLVHDETNPVLAMLLARLRPPFPVAMGVLLRLDACYEDGVHAQLAQASEADDAGDLSKVLAGRNTSTVEQVGARSRAPSRNCWNRAASTASCATSTTPSPTRVATVPAALVALQQAQARGLVFLSRVVLAAGSTTSPGCGP